MGLPEDLKNYEPSAFLELTDEERNTLAVVVIVLILFCNWRGWL